MMLKNYHPLHCTFLWICFLDLTRYGEFPIPPQLGIILCPELDAWTNLGVKLCGRGGGACAGAGAAAVMVVVVMRRK